MRSQWSHFGCLSKLQLKDYTNILSSRQSDHSDRILFDVLLNYSSIIPSKQWGHNGHFLVSLLE